MLEKNTSDTVRSEISLILETEEERRITARASAVVVLIQETRR